MDNIQLIQQPLSRIISLAVRASDAVRCLGYQQLFGETPSYDAAACAAAGVTLALALEKYAAVSLLGKTSAERRDTIREALGHGEVYVGMCWVMLGGPGIHVGQCWFKVRVFGRNGSQNTELLTIPMVFASSFPLTKSPRDSLPHPGGRSIRFIED